MGTFEERAEKLQSRADENVDFNPSWRPGQEGHPNPLIAVITSFGEANNEYGTTQIMNVRDAQERDWAVWLSHHALRSAIQEAKADVGQMVYIAYQGKKRSKRSPDREFHAYNVQVEAADDAAFQPAPAPSRDEEDIPF